MSNEIQVPEQHVRLKDTKFSWRKDELGNKRASITLAIPYLTMEGLVASLQDEKVQQYVLDLVDSAIYKQARQQTDDDTNPVNTQDKLDVSKLSLIYIANQPSSDRRGSSISDDEWKVFVEDYTTIMPEIASKTSDQCVMAAALFRKKFSTVKTDKKTLAILDTLLDRYIAASSRLEEVENVVSYLSEKVKELLNATPADYATAL